MKLHINKVLVLHNCDGEGTYIQAKCIAAIKIEDVYVLANGERYFEEKDKAKVIVTLKDGSSITLITYKEILHHEEILKCLEECD